MDNNKVDKITKDIISGSKLELTNPDFKKIIMGKVKIESRKQALFHNIKLYSMIFISIDTFIIVLLNLMDIRISDISFKINTLSRGFEDINSIFGQLIYIYFAVLFAVILIFNMISRTGYSYSKT